MHVDEVHIIYMTERKVWVHKLIYKDRDWPEVDN